MGVAIVIASYGEEAYWKPLYQRARVSAMRQTVPCVVKQRHYVDVDQVGPARNLAALEVILEDPTIDRLIFLDADDELDPKYVEEMLKVDADIVQPSTLGINSSGVSDPSSVLIPEKPLIDGNFIVIGAMISVEKFVDVDGFMDQPIYEDWDLWLRMWNAGSTIGRAPNAIYKVHVNENGRNSNASIQKRWYNAIRSSNMSGWNVRGSNVSL